jgi:MOSC domain-containing protein YiiM
MDNEAKGEIPEDILSGGVQKAGELGRMKGWRVESLNIGLPKWQNFHGREIRTGICKKPVQGSLKLSPRGFKGDGVGDVKHHGGEDKAVCVYSLGHYPYWEEVLGVEMPAAAFGENLSVAVLSEDDVYIGDIFRLGSALVQISQPRQPCRTLAARYNRTDMVKLVADSGRTGFYCRVLEEGSTAAGDSLIVQERDPRGVTVSFANIILHHDRRNVGGIEKILSVPALSATWRESFRKMKNGGNAPAATPR